jgi:hypothetical protein
MITLGNTSLVHDILIVFLTYSFTPNPSMQLKIFPSPTVFAQWHFLLLIYRNFGYFLQQFFNTWTNILNGFEQRVVSNNLPLPNHYLYVLISRQWMRQKSIHGARHSAESLSVALQYCTFNLAVIKKTVGDVEKLLTHLNSELKVLLWTDIFHYVPKKS